MTEHAHQRSDDPQALQSGNLPAITHCAQHLRDQEGAGSDQRSDENPRMRGDCLAPTEQKTGSRRQIAVRAFQQLREARHHDAEQEEHDQRADRQQQRRIDRGADHLVAQFVQRLQMRGVASQRRHQIAGLFAGGDRGDQQCGKRIRLGRQCLRQRQTLGQIGGDAIDCATGGCVALLQRERAYGVDHAEASIEQRRQFFSKQADLQARAPARQRETRAPSVAPSAGRHDSTRRLATCNCCMACCSLGAETRRDCTAPFAVTATTSNSGARPAFIAWPRPPARSTT